MAKKNFANPNAPKSNIVIGEFRKVDKEMPKYTGKGAKYAFLEGMAIGECICFPLESFNVPEDVLKRALQGAARRIKMKIICSREPEGFCVWRKE